MDELDALLGLYADPKTDMNALAGTLRGQRSLGDFLALSTIPQAAAMGDSLRERAVTGATRAGAARERGLARARQAEQDRLQQERQAEQDRRAQQRLGYDAARAARAAEEYEYEKGLRGAPSEAETWQAPGGGTVTIQRQPDGTYVFANTDQPVPDQLLGSLKPYDAVGARDRGMTGTRTFRVRDAAGNWILVTKDRETGEVRSRVFADSGEPVSPDTMTERADDTLEFKRKKEFGAETAKQVAKEMPVARDARRSLQQGYAELQNALNALDAGAWTGPVLSRYTPTLRASTDALEAARDRLALTRIGDYTFGSLSQGEQDWLKVTSLNLGVENEELPAQLKKRMEGMKRMLEANAYALREMEKGQYPDQAETDRILYGGGFTFSDPPTLDAMVNRLKRWLPEGDHARLAELPRDRLRAVYRAAEQARGGEKAD